MRIIIAFFFLSFLYGCQKNTNNSNNHIDKINTVNFDSLFFSEIFLKIKKAEDLNICEYYIIHNGQGNGESLIMAIENFNDSIRCNTVFINKKTKKSKFYSHNIFLKNPLTGDSTQYSSSIQYLSKFNDSLKITNLLALFERGDSACDFLEGCELRIIKKQSGIVETKYISAAADREKMEKQVILLLANEILSKKYIEILK